MSSPSESPDIEIIVPEFINEGELASIPIPRDDPTIVSPDIRTTKGINTTGGRRGDGFDGFDMASESQKILNGEGCICEFSQISIHFPRSTSLKGAYICLLNSSASPLHLLFTFTSLHGKTTLKRYEFRFKESSWFFLPIHLSDIALCEITTPQKHPESFSIHSLAFVRETTERVPQKMTHGSSHLDHFKSIMDGLPIIKTQHISKLEGSIPISFVDPFIKLSLPNIKAKDDCMSIDHARYDQSLAVQEMLQGNAEHRLSLSHLSIPFSSPTPLKGVYICVGKEDSSLQLFFTFTDSDGKVTYKKYGFPTIEHVCDYEHEWHFLPIDLSNVVLCEIEGNSQMGRISSRRFLIHNL
ncbi:hypothetical protein ADUPG1_000368, partial [Aduncisulcus paluster]